jgi:hypothetical protein
VLIAVGCGGCLQEMGTSINPYMACWGKNTPALLNNASDAHTASQQRHLIVQVKQYISTQVQQGAEGKPKPRALASNKLQSETHAQRAGDSHDQGFDCGATLPMTLSRISTSDKLPGS